MKILAIPGSLRAKSVNLSLLKALKEQAPDGQEVEICDLAEIPLFNEDLEAQGVPPAVTEFKKKIADADAIIIATPEYNNSVSGVLKNAIDWASRGESPFDKKPVGIVGASPSGFGTLRAQLHLKQILAHLNSYVMQNPELTVSSAFDKFNQEGKLTDSTTKEDIDKYWLGFIDWCAHFNG